VSEREHREKFGELTLLSTRGSKLCHTIIGPLRTRHHLSEGMRLVTLYHTKRAREHSMLRVVVSSTVESEVGCSPSDTFHMEVVGKWAAAFQKMEGVLTA
jgi:hypothetical protein